MLKRIISNTNKSLSYVMKININYTIKYTTIPENFIKDFFNIAKENYADTDIIINFDIVCKWLEVKKSHLKETLVANFEKDFDYTEIRLTKKSEKHHLIII